MQIIKINIIKVIVSTEMKRKKNGITKKKINVPIQFKMLNMTKEKYINYFDEIKLLLHFTGFVFNVYSASF